MLLIGMLLDSSESVLGSNSFKLDGDDDAAKVYGYSKYPIELTFIKF
jgi:hypothetical protein